MSWSAAQRAVHCVCIAWPRSNLDAEFLAGRLERDEDHQLVIADLGVGAQLDVDVVGGEADLAETLMCAQDGAQNRVDGVVVHGEATGGLIVARMAAAVSENCLSCSASASAYATIHDASVS